MAVGTANDALGDFCFEAVEAHSVQNELGYGFALPA
jgi:hypothetical protein